MLLASSSDEIESTRRYVIANNGRGNSGVHDLLDQLHFQLESHLVYLTEYQRMEDEELHQTNSVRHLL